MEWGRSAIYGDMDLIPSLWRSELFARGLDDSPGRLPGYCSRTGWGCCRSDSQSTSLGIALSPCCYVELDYLPKFGEVYHDGTCVLASPSVVQPCWRSYSAEKVVSCVANLLLHLQVPPMLKQNGEGRSVDVARVALGLAW